MGKFIVLFFLAGIFWLLYEWYEHSAIQYNTTRVEFRSLPFDKEVKFCLISDLHNNRKNIKRIISKIKAFSPDYIFLSGDMVDKHKKANSNAVEFINNLAKITQVYYAIGNHEEALRTFFPQEWQTYLMKLDASVVLLDNQGAFLDKEQTMYISGLSIPLEYYKKGKLCSDMTRLPKLSLPEKKFHVMLAHHPEYAPVYERYQADLILSGHLHGGLLRLPVFGGMVSPRLRVPVYDSGEITLSEHRKLFVSRGLGSHTIPLRFFNRAEINFIILEKSNE